MVRKGLETVDDVWQLFENNTHGQQSICRGPRMNKEAS